MAYYIVMDDCFTPKSAYQSRLDGGPRRINGRGTSSTTGDQGEPQVAELSLGMQRSQLLCSCIRTEQINELYSNYVNSLDICSSPGSEISWDQLAGSQLTRV